MLIKKQEELRRGISNEVKVDGKVTQKVLKLGYIEVDCSVSIWHNETVAGYLDNVC